MSEISDRRQRAKEAAGAALLDSKSAETMLDVAIETAIRVKITDAILYPIPVRSYSDALDIARDLFTAAGFEVIE